MFSYKFSFKEGKSKEAPLIVIPSFEDNTSQIIEKAKLLTDKDFSILTIYGFEWNNNLSPYKASAIFKGASDFNGEALTINGVAYDYKGIQPELNVGNNVFYLESKH